MNEPRFQKRSLFLIAYLVFAILPIYWMVNMSLKTNTEIVSTFTFWPRELTWDNYKVIFTDRSWYSGYINSLIYFLIILLFCFLLYNWMQRVGTADKPGSDSPAAGGQA